MFIYVQFTYIFYGHFAYKIMLNFEYIDIFGSNCLTDKSLI